MADFSSTDVTERMKLAERLAREAGRLALTYFNRRADLAVEKKKSAQDLVSEADREVERFIRRGVRDAFPTDALLGEEHGQDGDADGMVWVIDPIDGTSPFLVGMSSWAISIAVAHAGVPIVGAIYIPVLDDMYVAAQGSGAWLNGERLRIGTSETLRSRMCCVDSSSEADPEAAAVAIRSILEAGGSYVRLASAAVELAYVASNRLIAAYLAVVRAWDCFAGLCIVAEAGGKVMPFRTVDGTLSGPASVLVAAPQVYDEFHALMPVGSSGN